MDPEPSRTEPQTWLRERFDKLMISLLRRITDGGYVPVEDYLSYARTHGGIRVLERLLHEEISKPLLDALLQVDRLDLAPHFYIIQAPWCCLFIKNVKLLVQATEQLQAVGSPPPLPGMTTFLDSLLRGQINADDIDINDEAYMLRLKHRLETDGQYTWEDMNNLRLRRRKDAETKTPKQLLLDLAADLRDGIPLTLNAAYRKAFQDQPELKMEFSDIWTTLHETDTQFMHTIVLCLCQLKQALDFSQSRIEKSYQYWLERMNTAAVERGAILSVRDLTRILQISARAVAINVARYANDYNKTLDERRALSINLLRNDDNLNIVAELRKILIERDLLLYLRMCELCADIENGYSMEEPYEDVNIQGVDGVFFVKQIPLDVTSIVKHLDDGDAVFVPAAVTLRVAMQAAYALTHPSVRVEDLEIPTAWEVEDEDEYLRRCDVATRCWISIVNGRSGDDEREKIREALTRKLGHELFRRLRPEARATLIGADQVLCANPPVEGAMVVNAMGLAFELQLKHGLVEEFCEYLGRRGIRDWPPAVGVLRRSLLVRNGEVERDLSLGKVLSVLEGGAREFEEFCKAKGLDVERVIGAIRGVKRIRNKAAHEGGMGHEFAVQLREDWLDPTRGVFASIVSMVG